MKQVFLFATLLITTSVFAQGDLIKRMDSLTNTYEQNGFHGVILVAKGDEIIFTRGYGYANLDQQIRQTTSTQFKTESVGKMFTATSILQLIEKGKLHLNQTVKELLPQLNIKNANKITVDHLLKHTSGLQSPWDHPKWQFKKDYSQAELMKIVEEVPLALDTPGKAMFYSNSGYVILGWIIEKVTGKPFDQYFKEEIFSKLKMSNTRHLMDTLMPVKDGAQPYKFLTSKRYLKMDETLGRKASAAGGWISTAGDLHRFMVALSQHKLLKPETFEMMKTANGSSPKDSSYRFYAYGLETYINQMVSGANIYGHNGGGAGFSIDAFVEPETGYIVISCTNMYQNSRPIAMNYFRAALGKPLQPVQKPLAIRVYDLIDSVGIEKFVANEKDFFAQLNARVQPGLFLQVHDAMAESGDHKSRLQWTELARRYFPNDAFIYLASGDSYLEAGNKTDARKMYESARETALKQNDGRLAKGAEEKLKAL